MVCNFACIAFPIWMVRIVMSLYEQPGFAWGWVFTSQVSFHPLLWYTFSHNRGSVESWTMAVFEKLTILLEIHPCFTKKPWCPGRKGSFFLLGGKYKPFEKWPVPPNFPLRRCTFITPKPLLVFVTRDFKRWCRMPWYLETPKKHRGRR